PFQSPDRTRPPHGEAPFGNGCRRRQHRRILVILSLPVNFFLLNFRLLHYPSAPPVGTGRPKRSRRLRRGRAKQSQKQAGAWPPRRTQTVTDLGQLQALADPLRLRILGALTSEPRTTKQVADLLGEKHNKLYYHVEALERAGLIQLKETRPK